MDMSRMNEKGTKRTDFDSYYCSIDFQIPLDPALEALLFAL